MRTVVVCMALALTFVGTSGAAEAKGCIKGALIGGAAGHFAHHHTVLGAAVGCAIGHHEANKKAKENRQQ